MLAKARPWTVMAGGSALAAYGISQRSLPGAGLAALGGAVFYQGLREARRATKPIHVQHTVTIMRPVEEVYSFWRNFENLPRFMWHLRSVRPTADKYSHWEAKAPLGLSVGWDAEITHERENTYIVWRSLPGAMIANRGAVEFRVWPKRGTEVRVAMDYSASAGKISQIFAKMLREEPELQIGEDLRRFKQLLEAGEIATTEGQSSGRRTPWIRMMEAAAEGRRKQERTA